jgi:hypothetical protein
MVRPSGTTATRPSRGDPPRGERPTDRTGKGTGPAPFNFNQFGGSFGGLIIKTRCSSSAITKQPTRQGAAQLATVPPTDFQSGDLSRALSAGADASGNPIMVKTTEGGLLRRARAWFSIL